MSIKKDSITNIFTVAFASALKRYNLKKADIAKKTGIQASRIGEYAHGQMEPGLDIIKRIANAFGLSLSEFFASEEDIKHKNETNISSERELELLRKLETANDEIKKMQAEKRETSSTPWVASPVPGEDSAER